MGETLGDTITAFFLLNFLFCIEVRLINNVMIVSDERDSAIHIHISRLPLWVSGKESACNAGATGVMGLIPGLGRSLEEGTAIHSCSCLENPMDRGPWRTTVPRVRL